MLLTKKWNSLRIILIKCNYNLRIIDFFLSVENNPGVLGLFIGFYYDILFSISTGRRIPLNWAVFCWEGMSVLFSVISIWFFLLFILYLIEQVKRMELRHSHFLLHFVFVAFLMISKEIPFWIFVYWF